MEIKLWIIVCGNVLTEGKNHQLQFFKEEFKPTFEAWHVFLYGHFFGSIHMRLQSFDPQKKQFKKWFLAP